MRLISNLIFTKCSFCHSYLLCDFWVKTGGNLTSRQKFIRRGAEIVLITSASALFFILTELETVTSDFKQWAPYLEVLVVLHAISRIIMLFD